MWMRPESDSEPGRSSFSREQLAHRPALIIVLRIVEVLEGEKVDGEMRGAR